MARRKGRDRLAAKIQDLLAVDAQDRVALHEIFDFFAQPQGVDVAIGRIVAAGASALGDLALVQLIAPGRKTLGRPAVDRVDQLGQHRLAVADDGNVDVAGRHAELLGVDLDPGDLGVLVEARRCGMADHIVHPGAEDDDEIGLAKRAVAHRQIGIGVVVRHDAAALRGRVERDPSLLDKGSHLIPRLRPQHPAAGADDRLPRAVDRIDERAHRLRLGVGAPR